MALKANCNVKTIFFHSTEFANYNIINSRASKSFELSSKHSFATSGPGKMIRCVLSPMGHFVYKDFIPRNGSILSASGNVEGLE